MNLILIGFMGTGKTVTGKVLAKRLRWTFVDVDALIERAARKPIRRIFTEDGEARFRRLETQMIRRVARGRRQIIAAGGGAFIRPENRRLLQQAGVVVCLTSSPAVILKRVKRTIASRPMLAGATSPLARIRRLLKVRAPFYAKADLTIDASRLTAAGTASAILARLHPAILQALTAR